MGCRSQDPCYHLLVRFLPSAMPCYSYKQPGLGEEWTHSLRRRKGIADYIESALYFECRCCLWEMAVIENLCWVTWQSHVPLWDLIPTLQWEVCTLGLQVRFWKNVCSLGPRVTDYPGLPQPEGLPGMLNIRRCWAALDSWSPYHKQFYPTFLKTLISKNHRICVISVFLLVKPALY